MKFGAMVRTVLFAGLATSFGIAVEGLDLDRQISQYGHTAWRTLNGDFTGTPAAIEQTPDGYLWIGTPDGLMRFDGVRFVPWTPLEGESLPRTDILSLLSARDGSLWIGTGRGLAQLENGHLHSFPGTGDWVNAIVQDQDDSIWIARSQLSDDKGSLCRIAGGNVHCFGDSEGLPMPSGSKLARDSSGTFWVGGYLGLRSWRDGSSVSHFSSEFHRSQGLIGVEALAADRNGVLWAGIENSGKKMELERFADGGWQGFTLPSGPGSRTTIAALYVDHQGALWIGTSNKGIFRRRGTTYEHFGSGDGLSSDAVANFFEDREGTLWVATSKGIDSFRDLRVATYSLREGLSADSASTVLARHDGSVWVGNSGAVDIFKRGTLTSIREKHGLPGRNITTLFEDHAGRVWLGLDSGLWIYEHEKFRQILRKNKDPLGIIFGIAEDSGQNIWVLAGKKLVEVHNFVPGDDIATPQIEHAYAIASDGEGAIWLGLTSGDLIRLRHDQSQTFSSKPVGSTTQVRKIFFDSKGSITSVTLDGLVRWKDGKPKLLTAKNGLPCGGIYTAVAGDNRSIWLYSQCGLLETSESELEKWWDDSDYKIATRTLDVFDGVQPGRTPLQPQAARSTDGKFWFVNHSTVQMFDPHKDLQNKIPPPVAIEGIIADRHLLRAEDNVQLPPLTRDLEIDFAALSLAVPQKVQYRYMLEGHDGAWQEPKNRRQAFYSNLRPGKYRFRVAASNNDGVWNEVGAVINFELLPTFYQTNLFRALCVMSAIAGLAGLYLLRVRQVTVQIRGRLEERLGERDRIARELHDTLLQSIQGLILRFHAVAEKIPGTEPSRRMMEHALDRADEVMLEGRDRVRDLRVSGDLLKDLPQAFAQAGEEFAQDGTAEFRIVVEGQTHDLHPLVRDEAYWIGHEALANSFRHARAKLIEVEITYDSKELRIRFRDDGRGIAPDILRTGGRAGHWGMPGMRERAQQIGAHLETWSRPEAGTEVELKIPSTVAYRKNADRSRWRWLPALFRKGQT